MKKSALTWLLALLIATATMAEVTISGTPDDLADLKVTRQLTWDNLAFLELATGLWGVCNPARVEAGVCTDDQLANVVRLRIVCNARAIEVGACTKTDEGETVVDLRTTEQTLDTWLHAFFVRAVAQGMNIYDRENVKQTSADDVTGVK